MNKGCLNQQAPWTHRKKICSNIQACRCRTGTQCAQMEHEDWCRMHTIKYIGTGLAQKQVPYEYINGYRTST
jgi:hypothetical protein